MMADARYDDDEIFIYMGGDQFVPRHVRRVRIHRSVKIIRARAFKNCRNLIYVEFHDEIEIIEEYAFRGCTSLRGYIKLLGVKIIKHSAFNNCRALTDVEFGDVLETIENWAFGSCHLLRSMTMSSVRAIGIRAFANCYELSDVECGEDLETILMGAFISCPKLKRIVLPLKDNVIGDDVFLDCPQLATVDLLGGVHSTAASLHMESWRNEMMDDINRINLVLPGTDEWQKTGAVQQWMLSVIQKINHYKREHHKILKETTALLELALWKANLNSSEGGEREGVRTTRGGRKRARKEMSVTSGASIVIKNVLPFLVLK